LKKIIKNQVEKMKKFNLLIILIFIFFIQNIFCLSDKDMVGYWKIPSGKSIIKIVKEGNSYSGYVVWLKEPVYNQKDKEAGKSKRDRYNSNVNLRNISIIGLKVAGNLIPADNTKLRSGWVYDPFHGKKYTGTAEIVNYNTIRIRGAIDQNSIFGITQECKRVNPSDYGIKN
jgi:protein of unknown function DUF2147